MAASRIVPWTALLPLAPITSAKSRLRPASRSAAAHAQLVTALREDVAEALLSSRSIVRVLVVSADPAAADWAADHHFEHLAEQPEPDGLNGALRQAAAYAGTHWPADGQLAIVGDLPTATGTALDATLAELGEHHRGFVADHDGRGTTMLLAAAGTVLEPAFGPDSAGRHAASGAVALTGEDVVRLDVDTADDLEAALALPGAGAAHTRRVRARRS